MPDEMPHEMRDVPSRPKQVYHCADCGVWKTGPLRGRYDVPQAEIAALAERINGHPLQDPGKHLPARRRAGGTFYSGSMDGILSHGPCPNCAVKAFEENKLRSESALEALRGPYEYPHAYEEQPDTPEPTPEEARKFLSGAEDAGEGVA